MKQKGCPHCEIDSFALIHPLEETKNFWIVCDAHPLVEGHILIIPKNHISCIGKYNEKLFNEFLLLYKKVYDFVIKTYGSVCVFEHGIIGQTVFHSHVHFLSFNGKEEQIIPEGKSFLFPLEKIHNLKDIFIKNNQYLFFSIEDRMWTVDCKIGKPRFFRDRFANALNVSERGNWREMEENKVLMKKANKEINNLEKLWKNIQ